MDRSAAFAGSWYPGKKEQLESLLRDFLAGGTPMKAAGAIAPHAGYKYSGQVAGAVYARIEVPDRVVVLSPNHTGHGAQAALWPDGAWETPLGAVPVDVELGAAIRKECAWVELDDRAHRDEHSLELQLPFLRTRNPTVRIVPLTLMRLDADECVELGEAVARALQKLNIAQPLVIASSDMSHYVPAEIARDLDMAAVDRALALDARGLFDTVQRLDISMCGYLPATAMLAAARALGATRGEMVRYANSGDVTGDRDSVVGYAGVVLA
jgi:hypothetical protein